MRLAWRFSVVFSVLAAVANAAESPGLPPSAFIQKKTDRKPGPVMDAETIRAGLKTHDRALYIKAGWIRDPYLTLGPDDIYYLTGTQPRAGDPREADDPYNLYYCVADKITGPYGPRKFAGRFLGHGTPFRTQDGKWWCTAFFNANVPPLPREGIETRDLSEDAQTINEQGVTIVPLDVRVLDDDISIRAKDPACANPGPDEVQAFNLRD